jgi:hypothetical protein
MVEPLGGVVAQLTEGLTSPRTGNAGNLSGDEVLEAQIAEIPKEKPLKLIRAGNYIRTIYEIF